MARASFPCADCGAALTVTGRNRADADRYAKYCAGQGRICDDCVADRRAKASAEAAETAKAGGLPALTGTEKQVAWAETLRRDVMASIDTAVAAIDAARAEGKEGADLGTAASGKLPFPTAWNVPVDHADRIARCEIGAALLREKADAHWWIENGRSAQSAIAALKDGIDLRMKEATPDGQAQIAMEREAMEEALLLPAGDRKGKHVAEVRMVGEVHREVYVMYPVKNEAFNDAVKALDFGWHAPVWSRLCNRFTGAAGDRAAEAVADLLEAGFAVRCMDPEVRRKAVEGDWVPEVTRWAYVSTLGVMLAWGRDDDVYDAANRIPSAKYVPYRKLAYKEALIEEVADFAERHDFALDDTFKAALEKHRAELAAGVVAKPKKVAKKASVKAVVRDRPAPLVAVEGGIDATLLDDE